MEKTAQSNNDNTEAAMEVVIHEGYIDRNPEINEFYDCVDHFFRITKDSLSVASNLEESIRNVSFENGRLMRALKSKSETKRLEEIRKLAEQPNYFSETLLKKLIEVIDKYEELIQKLEEQLDFLNQKLEKQRRDITTTQEMTADKDPADISGMMKKVRARIVCTTRLVYELLRGIATANLTGMVDLISGRDGEKPVDLKSTMEKLWKDASETEMIREYVFSIETKVVVVHEFKNIQNNVLALNHKLNLLGKLAVEALEWKDEEGEEGIYNEIVGTIKEKGKQVGSDSDELEKEVVVWKKDVITGWDEVKKTYLIDIMKKLGS